MSGHLAICSRKPSTAGLGWGVSARHPLTDPTPWPGPGVGIGISLVCRRKEDGDGEQ